MLPASGTVGWASHAVVGLARSNVGFDVIGPDAEPPAGIRTLVVIGGGSLIDHAKLWRRDRSPATRLVAVPSLWGSGADASPVAVRTQDGRKVFELAESLRPDARATWPELAAHVPPALARAGYGDTWSHALEALFSPLASEALRARTADFIRTSLVDAAFEPDPAWFDRSAQAGAFQAASGVGLVHGIAHVLEPVSTLGHAQWCSLMLWPVIRFDLAHSAKVRDIVAALGLPWSRVDARIRELHDAASFDAALPLLRQHWRAILRDPLTRINAALVRPDSLAFFEERRFHEPTA